MIKPQPYGWGYVYDLTTENHRYAAGVGCVIVGFLPLSETGDEVEVESKNFDSFIEEY
jgi:hypothetical protein